MKIIKNDLKVGQRVICQLSGVNVYTAIVKDVFTDVLSGKKMAYLTREDERCGQGPDGKWIVQQNISGSWDGSVEREREGYGYWSRPNGRQHNTYTGGSWLYESKIENWKAVFPE